MLELALSDEQAAVRDVARAIGIQVLSENARGAESDHRVPDDVWAKLVATGLTAPIPERLGGDGELEVTSRLIALEEFAHGDAGIAAAAVWSGQAAIMLAAFGTPAQQAAHLPRFSADPSTRGAVALYEAFGRAPSQYRTVVVPDGEGWVVRGSKLAVSFGERADPLVVVGSDPTSRGRLRAVLVPVPAAGVQATPMPLLGLDAVPTATLDLDLVVGPDALLGGPDADPDELARAVARLRLDSAALAIGCAQRAIEYAAHYATERIAFGRPIAAFQGVSFPMVDAQMRVDAARLQVWSTGQGLASLPVDRIDRATSAAVTYATTAAAEVTRDCLQVLGGHGFITDHPCERWYRQAAGLAALDTDPTCSPFLPAL